MSQKPAYSSAITTSPRTVRLSDYGVETDTTVLIVSTAVDPGGTPSTSVLRAGLVLGKITASGKYKEYNNGSSDGSEVAVGILAHDVDLRAPVSGTAGDTPAVIMTVAEVDESKLIGIDANGKSDLTRIIFRSSTSTP